MESIDGDGQWVGKRQLPVGIRHRDELRAVMMASNGRGHRQWRDLAARLRTELPPVCWLCSKPIDLSLKHPDPWSWSLDHKTAVAAGGQMLDEANVAPAHLRCNQRKGVGGWFQPEAPKNSRRW